MNIILSIMSDVGEAGYGLRAVPIIEEIVKKRNRVTVICRDYDKSLAIKNCRFIKPLPFAKYIGYIIEGMRYYILPKGIGDSLFRLYQYIFDISASLHIKKGGIYHTWEHSVISLKKAKKKGMITVMDIPMLESAGAKKIYGKITAFYNKGKLSTKEKRAMELVDYYIVPSEVVKETYSALGVKNKKMFVVPFGVDTKKFYPIKKKKNKNKLRLLFVGVIRKRKRIDILMKAIDEIGKKDIELILCGRIHQDEKENVNYYKKKINIKAIGFVPHKKLNKVYNDSDVFIFPSMIEGSAKAIYEAMATGLPVVTTETSGSIVRDRKEGFIIPIADVNAIKNKILYFYQNPRMIEKMGKMARKRVEKYTWEWYGKRVCDIYSKIINK